MDPTDLDAGIRFYKTSKARLRTKVRVTFARACFSASYGGSLADMMRSAVAPTPTLRALYLPCVEYWNSIPVVSPG